MYADFGKTTKSNIHEYDNFLNPRKLVSTKINESTVVIQL